MLLRFRFSRLLAAVAAPLLFLLTAGGAAIPAAAAAQGEPVVLINTFAVPAGKTDEAIKMWEKARDFLQRQDGYISTRLHKSLADDARYRLVNVAQWESAAQFRAAAKALRKSGVFRPLDGVQGAPALYSVVRGGE